MASGTSIAIAPQKLRLSATIRGGLRLGGGQVATQACSFVRSVILARLISVQDYGVAAAFAMTLSLLEMISNVSADKLLIQAPDGDEPAFQNTAHFVHILRGFGNGLVLFVAAGPVAHLFGLPEAIWGFRSLGLLPVIRGFIHLDSNRVQRDMRFGPSVTIDVVSNFLVTLLVYPLAAYFRNYVAMLWILVIQAAVAAITSHCVAERRYGWTWRRCYTRRMFTFGWPLLINGLLLYGMMQGDRAIIGSSRQLLPHATYTLTDLGVYSVAFSAMMAPGMFVGNMATSLFLPLLSRCRSCTAEFQRTYLRTFSLVCLIAALITIPSIYAGPTTLVWIYGAKYLPASGIVCWLAAMWGLRIIRYVPTMAALALADSRAVMLSNLIRSLAFAGSFYAAATGKGLAWIAISGLAGECLALPALMWRLGRRHGVPQVPCLAPLAGVVLGMISSLVLALPSVVRITPLLLFFGTPVLTIGAVALLLMMVPHLWSDLRSVATAASDVC